MFLLKNQTSLVLILCLICAACVFEFYAAFFKTTYRRLSSPFRVEDRRFAVFSCATPEKLNTHRGFDYAFYLPLTVLAWQRIGFESIIVIIGEKSEWQSHPILYHVLDTLERLPVATVLFMSGKIENRMMLSQVVRICVANMNRFPGRSSDFVMTTDSDMWPLRKQHFYLPKGVNRSIILLHSDSFGPFNFGDRSYKMLDMMNVGASAATWREIMNGNSSIAVELNDSENILDYFQQVFGQQARKPVVFASDNWYMDQKMMSIRIDEWINRQNSTEDSVYKVSDDGLSRIDRSSWNPSNFQPSSFGSYYDAHLILDGFMPERWRTIQLLLHLMYDENSTQYEFCNRYATKFYQQFNESNSVSD
jgi:hypothetical protein